MDAALQENLVDLIGIARPMALAPDYPRRLLDGQELPPVAPRRIGIAALEGASELAWYSWQLRRLGEGQEPDRRASPWRALVAYLLDDAWEGFRLRSRQRRHQRLQRREIARLAG